VDERTAELAEEKERLAVTLGSIGDAVIATDVESRVILMNRVAEEVTGRSATEAQGHLLREIMPQFDLKTGLYPDPVAAVLAETIRDGLPAESLLIRSDGQERIVAENGAPIRDREGRTLGVVLAFRDVTDQRKVEDQLANSQKLEALGILAGGIAHDFNNLLTGVFGYVDMARRRLPEGTIETQIMIKALSLIERTRGLTGQLLTFSRGGEPVIAPLALGSQLQRNVEFALSGSNIVCEPNIAEDLWVCMGDRRQIDQVVDNLLLNARQAMPEGGVVTINARNAVVTEKDNLPLEPGEYVQVTVRDTGLGIPKEIRSRIFEPFFTTKPEGTGLGLATSYSIVHKHGGHIAVSSEKGEGATFSVYLPAGHDPARRIFSSNPPAVSRQCRILLMDDEKYICEVVADMLRELGHNVETAADGNQAVAAYEAALASNNRFDLVLLDLTIHGGPGGRAVLARLLEIDPAVKAVAASGYSVDPAMADPSAHGFAGKLTKPYTIDDLAELIARVLRLPKGSLHPK
jgi:PAS domain S-box-containing protein